MLPFSENQILVATRTRGFFLYDGRHFTPWKTPMDDFFIINQINYSYALVGNDYFAIGTVLNGLVIMDKTGKPIQWLNKEKGLYNNCVNSLYVDRQNNLWAALNNGISYIDINSPFSYYNEKFGFDAKCLSAAVHKDKLYIGGSPFIYYRNWSTYENPFDIKPFVNIKILGTQTGQFIEVNGKLLCTSNPYIYTIQNEKAQQIKISAQFRALSLLPLKNNPDLLLVSEYGGIFVLKNEHGNWVFRNKIRGVNYVGHVISEDDNNYFWSAIMAKQVIQFKVDDQFDSIRFIRTYDLPVTTYPSLINDKIIITTKDRFYAFNQKAQQFEPMEEFNRQLTSVSQLTITGYDNKGNIWYADSDELGVFLKQPDGRYSALKTPFYKFEKIDVGYPVFPVNDSNIIIGTGRGFIHYDLNYKKDYEQNFYTLIRRIS
jgi:ligand-binding sensor domain-containing protein